VLLAFLLMMVTYSLFFSIYCSMLAAVPDYSYQQNQMDEMVLVTAMKQSNIDIIAKETAPKLMSLVDTHSNTNNVSSAVAPEY
jgi:uncharacterized protein YcfL